MNLSAGNAIVVLALGLFGLCQVERAMAIEEPEYVVVQDDGPIEVRDYEKTVVAEVTVDASFEEAGSRGFRPLFEYISDNDIAMTAPVSQEPAEQGWTVSFMMPAGYSADSLPAAEDPRVRLREIPARRVATIRYTGSWSAGNYAEHLETLRKWLEQEGYTPVSDPVWARYNAPFSLWFMRRNEIHIAVRKADAQDVL